MGIGLEVRNLACLCHCLVSLIRSSAGISGLPKIVLITETTNLHSFDCVCVGGGLQCVSTNSIDLYICTCVWVQFVLLAAVFK